MEQVRKRLSCADANKMDMVDYLATIGYGPKKIRGNDYWYVSPFRDEKTPSFKVDRKQNLWYDHGEGKGGKLVDFGLAYYRCNVGELLGKLSGHLNLAVPDKRASISQSEEANYIKVTGVKELTNPALLQYADSRGIPEKILRQYCKEVSYTNGDKNYYAIGFGNDRGGYELRSKYFKGSSSPKDVTRFNSGSKDLAVFEGFFNFLSFQSLQKNIPPIRTDFLILNSLSFFEKARPIMESYGRTNLYLDNNEAGQKFTSYACSLNKCYQDKSAFYKDHEDLNDFLKDQLKLVQLTPAKKKGLRH